MTELPEEIILDYFAGLQIYQHPTDDTPGDYNEFTVLTKTGKAIPYRLTQVKREHIFTDFSTTPATVEVKPAWVYRRYRGR